MTTVAYRFKFPYNYQGRKLIPALGIVVRNPADPNQFMDTHAEIDSGAEYSLFDGQIARLIGVDLLTGKHFVFEALAGSPIESRIHSVVLANDRLGEFKLDLRFSLGPIARNILGRDFFNLAQIGFRERQSLLMITPEP